MTVVATRTEVEAAADALCSLLVAKLVPALKAAEAMKAVGIAPSDLRDATMRRSNGLYRPPRRMEVLPTLTDPISVNKPAETGSRGVFRGDNGYSKTPTVDVLERNRAREAPSVTEQRRRREYQPSPAKLPDRTYESFCAVCTQWKRTEQFRGRRCIDCANQLKRDRYLSVEKANDLEQATIRYLVSSDDAPIRCSTCGELLEEDDVVVAHGVAVEHADHELSKVSNGKTQDVPLASNRLGVVK